MPRPRLQIIRGLPGTGKTTLAIKRYSHLMRVEADMFYARRGQYRFSDVLSRTATAWYNRTVTDFCAEGFDFVVTGVFGTMYGRLEKTIQIATCWDYDIFIKTRTRRFKSVHAVPEEVLNDMAAAFLLDEELKYFLRENPNERVHFGLMSSALPIARRVNGRSMDEEYSDNQD